MGRLIKYLIYLVILAAILSGTGLVGYAYLGPWFGADFSPPRTEIHQPVVLDAD